MAKKIMIVEDDPSIRDYLEAIFQDNGYDTCTVTSGVDAIKMVKDTVPDLITLDLIMPGSWGNIFYRKLQRQEQFKDIPIIIISGAESQEPVTDEIKTVIMKLEKASAFLKKPFDKEELLNIVNRILN